MRRRTGAAVGVLEAEVGRRDAMTGTLSPICRVDFVNFKHALRDKLTLFTNVLKVNEVYNVHF